MKLRLTLPRIIILAAVAGLVAGGIGVYVMAPWSGNNPEAQAAAAEKLCTAKTARAKSLAAEATGDVAAMLPASPPVSLAGLAFNAPDGTPTTISAMGGKALLINLWATWCAPCRAEMPALDALQKQAGGENFEVVAVNVDTGDDAKPKKFLEETGIVSLAYYRDNTLKLFNDLKKRSLALGLPVSLLVDQEGCLLAHMNGPAEWAGHDALQLVEAAVALKARPDADFAAKPAAKGGHGEKPAH